MTESRTAWAEPAASPLAPQPVPAQPASLPPLQPQTPTRSFASAAAEVQTRTLGNGLTVVVWPNHNIPSVALQNWVRVGSRNEHDGGTGLAHFFEHMMFNGTHKRARGEFDRLMEAQGASNNAFTSQDVTVYQDWFPVSALELVFELESDRIANLAFDPAVVENERKVVYSERRLRVDDSNAALLDEQVQARAFEVHPYRIPTIGWPRDIESWSLADLQQFYRTYYAPNNCTLIVVGDVEPERVFALAERYFGAIPRGQTPPAVKLSRTAAARRAARVAAAAGAEPAAAAGVSRHQCQRRAPAGAEPAADHPRGRRRIAPASLAGGAAAAGGGHRRRLVGGF